jgi:dolichol-phosphate mannosyltransferase
VVYVDDGSFDSTTAVLNAIAESDPRVCVVSLARNFGHQAALAAGLRHCAGDAVAVMDADLQDPPEIVREMMTKWRGGYAVVYGVRRNRAESWPARFCYRVYYRLLSLLSDIEIPRDSGDFCVLDRRVVDTINALPEKNRFVRGLRAWCGGRQCGVVYDRKPRAAGRSKYSARKLFHLGFDGIFNFSMVPLRLIFWIGLASSVFALLGLVFFLAHRFAGFKLFGYAPADVPGFTTLVLSILLLSGAQLLSIGILGEYLGRIYIEIKSRPTYLTDGVRHSIYRDRPRGGRIAASSP